MPFGGLSRITYKHVNASTTDNYAKQNIVINILIIIAFKPDIMCL